MLTLVKYQGLGNDFLVALDGRGLDAAAAERAGRAPAGPFGADRGADPVAELARALCDRHTGVGADGLLVLRAAVSGGDVRMELRNADGSRAETSGNGLRCFALAAVEAGLVAGPELGIETDSGLRRAVLGRRDGLGSADVSVEMGCIRVRPLDPVAHRSLPGSGAQAWPAWFVDAGNPHAVVLAPSLEGVEISAVGPALEKMRPGGQNVEVVTCRPGGEELWLLVWERGAGVTLACGSGSVAAAAALHSAGVSAGRVLVHNPGGTAEVVLEGDDRLAVMATLAGPVGRVARVQVEPAGLERPGAGGASA
ncbi:MAG: diaminopimelate epimerase [Acidimicrobiales bacterium]